MEIKELLSMDFNGKDVLIIGCPASGKTWLSKLLTGFGHALYHTDDYIKHGYEQALYVLLNELSFQKEPTLIEGIQGYRLLRKGVQLNSYFPDIVIELVISEKTMMDVYKEERDEKKIRYLKGFNKMHEKIINDYHALPNEKKPLWLKVNNDR